LARVAELLTRLAEPCKTDLVRELGLSQGVVEKKTTIPILSNVLIEAKDDRIILTATDLCLIRGLLQSGVREALA
jgi:hypothetical protein